MLKGCAHTDRLIELADNGAPFGYATVKLMQRFSRILVDLVSLIHAACPCFLIDKLQHRCQVCCLVPCVEGPVSRILLAKLNFCR